MIWRHLTPLREAHNDLGHGLPTTLPEIACFSYDGLDESVANEARAAAEQIAVHDRSIVASAIEIGRTLIRMRPLLGHGHYLRWVNREAGLPSSTASLYVRVAEMVDGTVIGGKVLTVSALSVRTLGALAARSLDAGERDTILAEIIGHNPPKDQEVAARIAQAKSKAARPERKRETTRRLETAQNPAPEPDDRMVTTVEADPVEAVEDAVWLDAPSASNPPTPVPEAETPAVAPAVPSRSRRLSREEIGTFLFKVAEHLRDAGLAEDLEAAGDLIGDEELGRLLRAEIRGERPDATISAPDTEATDAARPFDSETT